APLVPTKLPRVLEAGGPGVGTTLLYDKQGNVYELVYEHLAGKEPHPYVDEKLALYDYGPITAAKRRAALGAGFQATPARSRGHRGYVLRGRYTHDRILLWNEDAHLYELGTGTPAKISMGDLRATAAGLQHLLGSFYAQVTGQGGIEGDGVEAVVADHAVYVS